MSSVLDFLFSGQPTPPQPVGSDTSSQYPLWLQQMTANIGNAATNLAGQDYVPYSGPQVATPSGATQNAWQMAQSGAGAFQPDLSQAETLTGQAAQPITSGQIQGFMNPYLDQVVGGLTSQSNKNLFENVLPGIQDRFVSSGQSRSPQEAQITSQVVGQSQKALNDSIAGTLGQGYQGALNTAIAEQGAKQTAGAQFGQLGAARQQLGAGDIGTIAAAGQGQDINNQANINAAMNNFYAQQQWPYQNLGFASNIIRGLPVNTNTQTVGQQYAPATGGYSASPLASFIGATSGSKALGFAGGGPVVHQYSNDDPRLLDEFQDARGPDSTNRYVAAQNAISSADYNQASEATRRFFREYLKSAYGRDDVLGGGGIDGTQNRDLEHARASYPGFGKGGKAPARRRAPQRRVPGAISMAMGA